MSRTRNATIYDKTPRQQAIAMYLSGAGTDDVCKALGLKRNTATVYLAAARKLVRHDPLLR
jgi:DNA-binding CsgD family transcriptional regulator